MRPPPCQAKSLEREPVDQRCPSERGPAKLVNFLEGEMSRAANQRAAIRHALANETQRERQRILDAHFPGGATAAQRAMVDVLAKTIVYRLQIARLNQRLSLIGQPEAAQPATAWAETYRAACAALSIPPALLTETEGQA